MELKELIKDEIYRYDIKNSSLVQKVVAKHIDQKLLQKYAKELFTVALFFPKNLSRIYHLCDDEFSKLSILNNLLEEEGIEIENGAHYNIANRHLTWISSFANAVGLDPQVCMNSSQRYRSIFKDKFLEDKLEKKQWLVAYAYLLGGEANLPRTFKHLIENLRPFVLRDSDLQFFTGHISADNRHKDEGIKLLLRMINDENQEEVLNAIREGANSWFEIHNKL